VTRVPSDVDLIDTTDVGNFTSVRRIRHFRR
jgi:hypothetical protein